MDRVALIAMCRNCVEQIEQPDGILDGSWISRGNRTTCKGSTTVYHRPMPNGLEGAAAQRAD